MMSEQMTDNLENLRRLKGFVIQLKAIYEEVRGQSIQKDVLELCKTSQKILQCSIDDNCKLSELTLCIEYYLPELIGILNQFILIKNRQIASEQALDTVRQIESFLPKAKEAFGNILEGLVFERHSNTQMDIRILMEDFKSKGLF